MEVEGFTGFRPPEAQSVAGVHPVAEHWHIVGDADGLFGGDPAHPVGTALVAVALGVASEAHETGLLRLDDLPGPAALQPLVGDLHLPAVADQLVEDAELVADAVAGGGDLQGGEGFEEAGGQAPEAAIAQARLLLHLEDLLDVVDAELPQGLSGFLLDAEHEQVVAQLGADQELGREIGHHLGRAGSDGVHAGQVAGHQPVAYGVAQRHVEVMTVGHLQPTAQGVEEVLDQTVVEIPGGQAVALRVGIGAGFGQTHHGCEGGAHGGEGLVALTLASLG